jgi:predicted phage terminase large subunit-like protein
VERFLPHYLTAAGSAMHAELLDTLGRLHTRRGSRVNRLAPRGSAKSTLVSKAYPLWCAVEGAEPFVLLLSDTGEQAGSFLAAIKSELEHNAELRRAYPDVRGVAPVWKSDVVKLRNGVMVMARGSGGRIRGLTNGNRRPTLIVIDDANKKEDVYSPTMRRRVIDWIDKDVMPVGEPQHTNFVSVGTAIHREAVVCHLGTSPTWETRTYKAIQRFPDRMDLWGKWEQVLSNLGDPDRVRAAADFYAANSIEMTKGASLLWPERFPLDFLMRERATLGAGAFDSEYQDTPGTDGATEFPPQWFTESIWFHDWPEDLAGKAYFLDPSKGRTDKPGDWQAHVWGGWSRERKAAYFEADLRREPGPAMVERAARQARAFGASSVTIETNSDNVDLLFPMFRETLANLACGLGFDGIHHSDPKLGRIRSLGPYLARGQIRIRQTPGGRECVSQLRDVPSGQYDDGPDALAGCLRRVQTLLR